MEGNFTKIQSVLLQYGFIPEPGYEPLYKGKLVVNNIEFELEVSDIDTSFLNLPIVKLTYLPDGIGPNLTNINKDLFLCYLDREGHYLDQYNPEKSMVWIIESIKNTLKILADPKLVQKESADEFTVYWEGEGSLFLRSESPASYSIGYTRTSLIGESNFEIAVVDSEQSAEDWQTKRNVSEASTYNFPTILINLEIQPTIPLKDDWPPKNINEYYNWLNDLEPKTAQSLIDKLTNLLTDKKSRNRSLLVVLKTTSGSIAFKVEFNKKIYDLMRRFSNKVKVGQQARRCLLSNKNQKSFIRCNVMDASSDFIIERNLTNEIKSLSNKKIALIGCGTIGGYAAMLLVQAGAGNGKGKLDLYDGDILQPDNLGRHCLPAKYLSEMKSLALKDYINQTSVSNDLSINANSYWAKKDTQQIPYYDVVIDATGFEQFSTVLSHHAHHEIKNFNLLHVWVDAGGLAVRGLIDDGSGACYRCLKSEVNGALKDKLELFNNECDSEMVPQIKRQCGNSFHPYTTQASVTAAGLVQKMALDIVNNTMTPTFRHFGFSEIIKKTKNINLKATKGCPNCQTT